MSSIAELLIEPRAWLTAIYRKRYTFALICAHQAYFRRDFMDWLYCNYHVWLAFEHEANMIWQRGRRHYSARTIGEYLRHESALREAPNQQGWKVDNDFLPDLARLYMLLYQDRDGFFERRSGPLTLRAA